MAHIQERAAAWRLAFLEGVLEAIPDQDDARAEDCAEFVRFLQQHVPEIDVPFVLGRHIRSVESYLAAQETVQELLAHPSTFNSELSPTWLDLLGALRVKLESVTQDLGEAFTWNGDQNHCIKLHPLRVIYIEEDLNEVVVEEL